MNDSPWCDSPPKPCVSGSGLICGPTIAISRNLCVEPPWKFGYWDITQNTVEKRQTHNTAGILDFRHWFHRLSIINRIPSKSDPHPSLAKVTNITGLTSINQNHEEYPELNFLMVILGSSMASYASCFEPIAFTSFFPCQVKSLTNNLGEASWKSFECNCWASWSALGFLNFPTKSCSTVPHGVDVVYPRHKRAWCRRKYVNVCVDTPDNISI